MSVFGKTTKGSHQDNLGWFSKWGCRFQAPQSGVNLVISARLRTDEANGEVVAAIYEDENGVPGALLDSVSRVDIPSYTEDWHVFQGFSLSIVAGNWYWFSINTGENYVWTYYDIVAGVNSRRGVGGADRPPPDNPFGPGTDYTDREYSIYATYEPTGPLPPEVSVTPPSADLQVDQTETFTANVIEGTPPYNIEWIDKATESVIGGGATLPLSFPSAGTYIILARVTDASELTVNSPDVIITVVSTHTLAVNSIPIEGIPFTIEKVN